MLLIVLLLCVLVFIVPIPRKASGSGINRSDETRFSRDEERHINNLLTRKK